MMPPTRTEDLVEIQQLLAKYAVTITQGDIDGSSSVFTPDGTWRHSATPTLNRFPVMSTPHPGLVHDGTAPSTSSRGADDATGTSRCASSNIPKHDMRIGYYRDTYVRTDDGWRLKTRAMTFIRQRRPRPRPAPCDRQARSRMTGSLHRDPTSSGPRCGPGLRTMTRRRRRTIRWPGTCAGSPRAARTPDAGGAGLRLAEHAAASAARTCCAPSSARRSAGGWPSPDRTPCSRCWRRR